jgi:hypothetical protein
LFSGKSCPNVHSFAREAARSSPTFLEATMKKTALRLHVEELEQRIAPDTIGNPGNNNPPLNNTNNPGNEGTGGQVSTGG